MPRAVCQLVRMSMSWNGRGRCTADTYFGCADVLPGSLDASCLEPALGIDPLVPGSLNPLLDLEYGRNGVAEFLVAPGFGVDDIGRQHLDVPVATEPP